MNKHHSQSSCAHNPTKVIRPMDMTLNDVNINIFMEAGSS